MPYSEFSDPQSLNLYTYVLNIPTTRYDPDGHDPLLAIDIIQFLAAHFGHVGTVEGNVRSEYNARIAETKANQGEVSQHGESAMKSLTFGLVIDDTIDNHLNLAVTPDGKVDVDPGSTARDFPSLEVYSYTMDEKGNVTSTLILDKREASPNDKDGDLGHPEKTIKDQVPK